MRLLIVVSMVKTLSFAFATRPMRSTLVASAELPGSMYEWQARITLGLWCALRLRYPQRPTATDLCPPSMGTKLRLT
jgi:hypothetical protein